MSAAYVIGYDPGGRGANGVAVLRVVPESNRWTPIALRLTTLDFVSEAVDWVSRACSVGRIIATGVDTLTEWSTGPAGARPADLWLRGTYPDIAPRIVFPVALRGSMVANGAAFLLQLRDRFVADRTAVTEAHPKVCYRGITGRGPSWNTDRTAMAEWLVQELGVGDPLEIAIEGDHGFDAVMAALAALRGVNGEWTRDLHALPHEPGAEPVRYFGRTHYWWPE